MKTLESLDEQLQELLLVNGGDINIIEYPYIIKEAQELGLNQTDLARRIHKVYSTLDRKVFDQIDKMLEEIILKGSLFEKEAEVIIKSVEGEQQRSKTVNYILSVIRKIGFKTRDKKSPEADSFKNLWMTDEAWKKYQQEQFYVIWLDEKAHSLEELGEISFRKKEEAKYYLRNTNFLIPHIGTLTRNSSKQEEYSKIIENEPDSEKRYLKVVYRLNTTLPFRIETILTKNLNNLAIKTNSDYGFFEKVADAYAKGYVHIWLNETSPENKGKLTADFDYNSFLKFLYRVNKDHAFYLNDERFDTPESLIQKVQADASYWDKIAKVTINNQLFTWFEGIGKYEWIKRYNKETEKFLNSPYHSEEDKKRAAVQALIQIIDSSVSNPRIVSDQQQIQLLSVEGSSTIEHAISLQLQNSGFVKAKLYLNTNVEGISLSSHTATFFSQNGVVNYKLLLSIAALRLIKDKLYSLTLIVQTEYETLSIPVEIKVVFPKKAFYTQLIKYSVLGGVFLGIIRWVTGIMAGTSSWFSVDNSSYVNNYYGYQSQNHFTYFIALVLLLSGVVGSIFLIKKIEKL